MKKFLSVMLIAIAIIFVNSPVQAENNFDLNKNFNSQLQPVSYIYSGRVVGISTYLTIREQPSVNSREVMRIPNGAQLELRYSRDENWWEVLSVTFDGETYRNKSDVGSGLGWVSSRYVQAWQENF